jgi:hypothetical protein
LVEECSPAWATTVEPIGTGTEETSSDAKAVARRAEENDTKRTVSEVPNPPDTTGAGNGTPAMEPGRSAASNSALRK